MKEIVKSDPRDVEVMDDKLNSELVGLVDDVDNAARKIGTRMLGIFTAQTTKTWSTLWGNKVDEIKKNIEK